PIGPAGPICTLLGSGLVPIAVAAVTAPSTAAAAMPTAVPAAATRAIFARSGFVHSQGAAHEVGAVHRGDRAFTAVGHLDGCKSAAATGLPVHDYLSACHGPVRAEGLD